MRAKFVAAVHLTLPAGLCVYSGVLCSRRGWPPMRTAGFAILICGFLFWAAARIQLGKSFAVQAKAKELVTAGIYSKIRNPIYVFGTLLMLGFFLVLHMPLLLLLLLIIVPLQIVRARKESRVLEQKFGEAYRDYRAKTWF